MSNWVASEVRAWTTRNLLARAQYYDHPIVSPRGMGHSCGCGSCDTWRQRVRSPGA